MRLAAQACGGYYPAHKDAITHVASFIQAPSTDRFSMLDPCAGEGLALRQLTELLNSAQSSSFAIELDESRAEILRATLPDANVLAPADFFGCRATRNSFSFIWLNPPFDDAYGGSRVEEQFLWRSTDWLISGGVMALVCPEDVVYEFSDARRHFTTFYENCMIVPFPEAHRPYGEVVVLGHKRSRPEALRQDSSDRQRWEKVLAPNGFRYQIPPGNGPRLFQKVEPTEPELRRMLDGSPLRRHLTASPEIPLPSPPLPLGIGHMALLLASGHLNGIVEPEGKPAHVVRGTSRKRSFVSDVAESDNSDGGTTTRTTISERIELVIRTVDASGRIQTFEDTDSKGASEEIADSSGA
jgi:hypothetical protein